MSRDINSGLIFDIQRFSIHDGPGIRTTVFLKGCPLGCLWCHNPESRSNTPQMAFYKAKCIGCGHCFSVCQNGAMTTDDARVDRLKCRLCGSCAEGCPGEALKVIGHAASVAEVVGVVMRDEPFYKTSGGGVTLSGGEPLYQCEFSLTLLKAFKQNRLHTAVETCGCASWDKLDRLVSVTDLFFYDIKVIDHEKHRNLCRTDNSVILSNARRLVESGAQMVFRTPVIPGLNDSADDLQLLGEFVLSLPGSQRLELMSYNRIGSGKYEALGMQYALPDVEAPENLDKHKAVLVSMGVNVLNP